MIKVNLAVFIAFLVTIPVISAFILHILNNKWFLSKEKDLGLQKMECEICGLFSYINNQAFYWRCPSCESLNQKSK